MRDGIIETHRSIIDARHEGMTLADYLGARFTYFSREAWIDEIGAGRITLNGKTSRGAERLVRGDAVSYAMPERGEPAVETRYDILLEDDDFLFVNKPANLPCHPGGIYRSNTLLSLLREREPEARLVNRLDRETSGVVVVAKNAEAASRAGTALSRDGEATARGTVEKEYLALVEGDFPDRFEARGWLSRDTASPVRKKLAFSTERGEISCETFFTRVARHRFDDGAPYSRVRAVPVTGRTHQIRATLRSLGYPVVGDKLYGRDDGIFLRFIEGIMAEQDERTLRMPHHALHCYRTALELPGEERREALAPLPSSWPADIPLS